MNKINCLISSFVVICLFGTFANCFSQNTSIELSFTAINNTQYHPLDSIKIINLTQAGDTLLNYPDTILFLDIVSFIPENETSLETNFSLAQNSPNPFEKTTLVKLHMATEENIKINISDQLGRQINFFESVLSAGLHTFEFSPAKDRIYLCTVIGEKTTKTIKMLTRGKGSQASCYLDYVGFESSVVSFKSKKSISSFIFNSGDELMFIGNAGGEESAVSFSPYESQLIEFQFATNIPCPGAPSIIYEGQEYNTIQIFSQCWMKESLNFETANSWCIYNNPDYCDEYGRLYLWESTIGLCPPGWHLPSDTEWGILEGVSDSHFDIQDPIWYETGGWRGLDAGTNLKSLSGWYGGGNGLDLLEFTAKPGGYQLPNGNNGGASIEVGYWTSSEHDNETAWHRFLQFSKVGVYRYPFEKEWGLYVRCLKN